MDWDLRWEKEGEGLGEKSEQGEESLKDEPFRCAEHPHDTARCAADAKHAVVLERILFAWQEIRSLLHLSAKQAAATLRTKPLRLKIAFQAWMQKSPGGAPGWPDKELARAAKQEGETGVREMVECLDAWASMADFGGGLEGFEDQSPSAHSTLLGATPTGITLKSIEGDLYSTMGKLGGLVFAFNGTQEQQADITSQVIDVYTGQLKRVLDAILRTFVLLNSNAKTGQDMQGRFNLAQIISGSATLNPEECLLAVVEMEKCQEFIQKLPLALVGISVEDFAWPVSQWSVTLDLHPAGTQTSFGISAGNPRDIIRQAKQMVLITAQACCPDNIFKEYVEVIFTYGQDLGLPEIQLLANGDGRINDTLSPGDSAPMMVQEVIPNEGPSHHPRNDHWQSLVGSASWTSLFATLKRAVKKHEGQKFEQEREHHDLLANIQSMMEQIH